MMERVFLPPRGSAEWRALMLRHLESALQEWASIYGRNEPEWIVQQELRRVKPFLPLLLKDNSQRSAEDLAEIAGHLSPGGAHDGGMLVNILRSSFPFSHTLDPLLLAAMVWRNWHGGKIGFQFLPDPATVTEDEYHGELSELVDILNDGAEHEPCRLLDGDDLAFFNSLPPRFTIYRGCAGISTDQAAAGLCWTTQREIAEWFAHRSAVKGRAPVLVSARVKKGDVVLVKASEFEVVARVYRWRKITCRAPKPNRYQTLDWQPTTASPKKAH